MCEIVDSFCKCCFQFIKEKSYSFCKFSVACDYVSVFRQTKILCENCTLNRKCTILNRCGPEIFKNKHTIEKKNTELKSRIPEFDSERNFYLNGNTIEFIKPFYFEHYQHTENV
jgi:hypothetical protein